MIKIMKSIQTPVKFAAFHFSKPAAKQEPLFCQALEDFEFESSFFSKSALSLVSKPADHKNLKLSIKDQNDARLANLHSLVNQ